MIVKTTFRDFGKKMSVAFALDQDKSGVWKISDISYPDGTTL